MTFSIDNIKQDWLGEGKTPYSTEEIVTSFNEVEATLGADWLPTFKSQFGYGILPTMTIVSLCLKLHLIKKGVNFESLVAKLKLPITKNLQKAFAELNAIATICNNEQDIQFELEPIVQSKSSMPDFRVKKMEKRFGHMSK